MSLERGRGWLVGLDEDEEEGAFNRPLLEILGENQNFVEGN